MELNIAKVIMQDNDVYFKKVLVTPEMAADWIDNNYLWNREPTKKRLTTLAAALVSGKWNSVAPIQISKSGKLLDGSHRLRAIIATGISVELWVAYNVPEENFSHIDNGWGRTLACRSKTTRDSCGALSWIWEVVNDGKTSNKEPETITQLEKMFCTYLDMLSGTNRAFFSSAPVRAAAVVSLALGKDKQYVIDSFNGLVNDYQDLKPAGIDSRPLDVFSRNERSHGTATYYRYQAFYEAMFTFDSVNARKSLNEKAISAEFKAESVTAVKSLFK